MIFKIESVFYIAMKKTLPFSVFKFFWWVVSRTVTPQLEHTYSSGQFPLVYIRVRITFVMGTILGDEGKLSEKE